MNVELGYSLAFITGIMGGLHCLGMCGGFASGCFVGYGWQPKLQPHIIYHTARIAIYTLLGVGGALLGSTLIQTGIIGKGQGIFMITAGCVVVIIGLWLAGVLQKRKASSRQEDDPGYRRVLFDGLSKRKKSLPLVAGIANGLVPCSLLFSVAIKATASGDPLYAAGLMLCFGLGTIPTMFLVTTTGAVIGERARGIFARLAGIAVIILGLWTIYEGVVFYDIMRGLAN
jgi:sulfite exporter TauE/SafE